MILQTHTHTSTDFPTDLNLCTWHVPVYFFLAPFQASGLSFSGFTFDFV